MSPLKLTSRIIWTMSERRGSVAADRRASPEPPGPAQGLYFPLGTPMQIVHFVWWASRLQQSNSRRLLLTTWDVHWNSEQNFRGVDVMLNWNETLGHYLTRQLLFGISLECCYSYQRGFAPSLICWFCLFFSFSLGKNILGVYRAASATDSAKTSWILLEKKVFLGSRIMCSCAETQLNLFAKIGLFN